MVRLFCKHFFTKWPFYSVTPFGKDKTMENQKKLHPYAEIIRDRIMKALQSRLQHAKQESVAIRGDTTTATVSRTQSGKRGKNLSLSMAIRLWEGLGWMILS
jgi:anaerobic glycerol-3-phosphate dehydrogenase